MANCGPSARRKKFARRAIRSSRNSCTLISNFNLNRDVMKNTLETRLGIFFALALVVAVVILELIGAADFFKTGYQVNAVFKNAQELKKGDLVKLAGVEIGRVESIDLTNNMAQVTMKIKGKFKIKTDAKASVKFIGLMGNNFVSVESGSPKAP